MKPGYARLRILLARDALTGLVIRHGTAKPVCTLSWDLKKDTFALGQWMRGRIESCDLSPDGKHAIYSARRTGYEVRGWTAVSRTPYLKALAFYPRCWGGGWFLNDRDYCVAGGSADVEDRESPEVRRVEAAGVAPVRTGWSIDERVPKIRGEIPLVRPAGADWELRCAGGRYALCRGELRVETREWDWADVDRKRLVFTMQGCLYAAVLRKDGLHDTRQLHDFNGMEFEPLIAPYPGGEPVKRPPSVAPISKEARKILRKPVQPKAKRGKVWVDEEEW